MTKQKFLELLKQSEENFFRNFGENWAATWIYNDLAELVTDEPKPVAPEQLEFFKYEYDGIRR